jgi:hypothetical protein
MTEAQRAGLAKLNDDGGGIAGSQWYPPEWIGGRPVGRALNKLGFAAMKEAITPSPIYCITPAGRRALAQEKRG